MNTIYKILVGFALFLGVVALGNAAVISWFGAGSGDDVKFMLGNYLSGEAETFAQTEKVFMVMPGPWDKEEVAASATDQNLGTAGSTGDYISHCMITVGTAATGTSELQDGTNTAFDNIPMTAANTAIGVYRYDVEAQATTAEGWEITTGAGATAACFGRFDTAGD